VTLGSTAANSQYGETGTNALIELGIWPQNWFYENERRRESTRETCAVQLPSNTVRREGENFTAITRVQIPSGTPNRIWNLRLVSPKLRGCTKPRFCVLFAPSKPSLLSATPAQSSHNQHANPAARITAKAPRPARRFAGPTAIANAFHWNDLHKTYCRADSSV